MPVWEAGRHAYLCQSSQKQRIMSEQFLRSNEIVKAIEKHYESTALFTTGFSLRGIKPRIVPSELYFDVHNQPDCEEEGITFPVRDFEHAVEVLSAFSSKFDVSELNAYLKEQNVDVNKPLFISAFRGVS